MTTLIVLVIIAMIGILFPHADRWFQDWRQKRIVMKDRNRRTIHFRSPRRRQK